MYRTIAPDTVERRWKHFCGGIFGIFVCPKKACSVVKGDGGVEASTKAISSALGSFGSEFTKDIGSVISSSIKEPVNEMRDQIKEGRLDNSN